MLDVVTGCIFTDVVTWFIIVACAATLWVHGFRNITYAADAAAALKPLAGQYAYILFAVGLFNASLFAASILPLSTAYTVCEGLGLESGVDKSFKEAPFFYWLYTLLIAGGASQFGKAVNWCQRVRQKLISNGGSSTNRMINFALPPDMEKSQLSYWPVSNFGSSAICSNITGVSSRRNDSCLTDEAAFPKVECPGLPHRDSCLLAG